MNDKLEKAKQAAWNEFHGTGLWTDTKKAALEFGFDAGVAYQGDWTAVEDELPDIGEYDVTTSYGTVEVADFIGGKWYDEYGNEYFPGSVIAWKARPKPYTSATAVDEPAESEDK